MNTAKWIRHFESNRLNRPEPDWRAPILLAPSVITRLIPSLEQFQLGDGGGPGCLIARDAERFRGSSPEMRRIVDLWFAEEHEHSRLLGGAVLRFGGKRIEFHWSFTAFCATRRILGIRFELEVLLLTEIVSTAYYRVMRRHADDAPIQHMCSLILRDEAGHIAFHRDRLADSNQTRRGLSGLFWEIQFWICGHGAAAMLWLNHGRCLEALGGSRSEYFREVRFEISRFVRRLSRKIPAPTLTSLKFQVSTVCGK